MEPKQEKIVLLKQPSAWIPVLMSLAGLALLLGYLAYYALTRQPGVQQEDEGAAAHIWQLLMGGQLPFVAYFVIRWLPARTVDALKVLALMALGWIANFGTLYYFEHL